MGALMSETRQIISSSRSRLRRFLAETSTKTVPLRRRPLVGNQAAIGKLLLYPLRVGVGLVDLVDGHDDWYARGLGVIDGLQGLRHHSVVGGNHDDNNIRHLGAARAHPSKSLVAGGIEEDDFTAVCRRAFLGKLHFISADVLSDSAGFASRDVGLADGVQQRGLAVIDVAHDSDNGERGTSSSPVFSASRTSSMA